MTMTLLAFTAPGAGTAAAPHLLRTTTPTLYTVRYRIPARPSSQRARICACSTRENERQLREEQAEIASIDRLASSWIGTSISRWEWYEGLKSRRARLKKRVQRQERELDSQFEELKHVLLTLDALFGIGLVEKDSDRISIAGWALVLSVSFANFVFAYAVFELFSNIFFGAFQGIPF